MLGNLLSGKHWTKWQVDLWTSLESTGEHVRQFSQLKMKRRSIAKISASSKNEDGFCFGFYSNEKCE